MLPLTVRQAGQSIRSPPLASVTTFHSARWGSSKLWAQAGSAGSHKARGASRRHREQDERAVE